MRDGGANAPFEAVYRSANGATPARIGAGAIGLLTLDAVPKCLRFDISPGDVARSPETRALGCAAIHRREIKAGF